MNDLNQKKAGYSSDVRMRLRVNGHSFRIGQLGPDFIILDDPSDSPPGAGEITMSIDGRARSWAVELPDGISIHSLETRVLPVGE